LHSFIALLLVFITYSRSRLHVAAHYFSAIGGTQYAHKRCPYCTRLLGKVSWGSVMGQD